MRFLLPINHTKSAGFTLIEILIIAPIVVLMIGAFVGLMVSMVGDVLTTRDRAGLAYDTQNALDRIEQDARLSTQFLTTSGAQTAPQGSNNNFTGTSAFVNATSVIFSELATDRNPTDPSRMLTYYASQPNPCGASQNLNRVMLTKVIYFIKGSSLWRRTIVPDSNLNISTPDTNTTCTAPWQKNSCSPGYAVATRCGTNDEEILKNLSTMNVYYFNNPGDTTATSPSNALNASTISTTITTSKQVAGRTVTNSGSMRATKLNSVDTTVVPPAAPVVTHNFNTPNSVQFTWAGIPTATTYQLAYKINSGDWTNQTLNATDSSLIVTANRNDVVSFKVAAFNGGGGSAYTTDSATMPAWTDLVSSTNWGPYNSTYNTLGFTRTSSGRVFLRGLIKDGTATSGAVIATLPPGYRPTNKLVFPAATSPNNPARVDVLPDGSIVITTGNNTFLSLDNISFMPDSSLLPNDQQYTWRELINNSAPVNGWTNWGTDSSGTFEPVHAMIDNLGRVNMQGLAKAGNTAANTTITTTGPAANAAAYFPPKTLHFQAGGNGFSDFWIWNADGDVVKRGAQTSSYMGLNTMWYPGTKTGATGWATLPITASTSWVSYDNGVTYPTAQYTKGADGVVTVRGLIKGGGNVALNTASNPLPAGYRPGPRTDLIVVPSNDAYGRVDVGSDGIITVRASNTAWLALNFSYVADQ